MEGSVFYPDRRRGLGVHIGLSLLLAGLAGGSMFLALQQEVGSYFMLLLLLSLVSIVALAWVLYRGYALLRARYILERDGLRLRWGLRLEDIPLPEVEWIATLDELGFDLPVPRLRMPGSLTGTLQVENLGTVEFMASERRSLLLLGTHHKVFAISPEDVGQFRQSFQRAMEMGSLTPIAPFSALPAVFLQRAWSNRWARRLVLSSLVASLALFVIVSLIIPGHSEVSIGFDAAGQPMPPVHPERLLLVPVLGSFVFLVDLLAGLFFFRKPEDKPVAYLLWGASVLTPILLLIATFIMI
jgi:hypothetical protein